MIGWLVSWLIGYLAGWLVGWLISSISLANQAVSWVGG